MRKNNSPTPWSPHFHKPTVQFIGQALYGIQASGDVKLASWVRLKRRNLISWKGTWDSEKLAAQVTMSHRATVRFDSHGRETKVPIQFGAIPVELPDIPDVPLHLVVVKGFGTHPMILLTSLAKENTYKSL